MEAHRTYQHPIVRAFGGCTAHPSPEAWRAVAAEHGPGSRFAALQRRMVGVHVAERAQRSGRTMVVVPSRTVEKWHAPVAEHQAYEERLLCLVLRLRDPGLRIVYVTSSPVAGATVDYYLSLLPGPVRRSARARLTLLAAHDDSPRPLAEKVLEQPRLLTRIRWAIADRELCHLAPYTTTTLERDLALALDIPMYGPDPCHSHLGTKSGARRLFAQSGVPHPLGIENVTSKSDVVSAIARLRAVRPELAEVVVKLDEGVSGEGNAIVDVRWLPAPGDEDEAELIGARVAAMALEADGLTVEAYLAKLAGGGIVEERIVGEELCSPSVQLELTPAGEVEVVSTHDQLLGGQSGQSYLGCRFPAAAGYARQITELALQVGRRLARAEVIGRCAIDFVAVRDRDGQWRPYAIELNLRKGGTTHPLATLELLTGGSYETEAARFVTPAGAHRHYVATDHLEAPELSQLDREALLDLVAGQPDLTFDRARRCGVVFHMISALQLGRLGLTAVGDSAADAQRRYERAQALVLDAAAGVARAVA
jgi:hypothetical protein